MKKLLNKYLPLAYGMYFNTISFFSEENASKKAFRLFCTPRKGNVLLFQEAYLNNAKTNIIKVGIISIQTYQWKGEKETVLLMHGWESNVFRWRKLIATLQGEGYNIIAFDAPAHGNSSGKIINVPIYEDCAQQVIEKYRPQYLIGHSMGGMTSIYNQYKNPNSKIEKIVSMGAYSELSEITAHYQKMLGFNDKVLQGLDHYFKKNYEFGIHDFSLSKFAQQISRKGLLIHDESDAIVPVSASERIHANWKGSKLIKTKGLGHSLHDSDVNNHIITFLKS